MKYCPTCDTRYDEDILRFCMKDGTPLIDEEQPNFVAMPSESLESEEEDDAGEVTIIRRNKPAPTPAPSLDDDDFESSEPSSPRIVVPMTSEPAPPTPGRPLPRQTYQEPPRKPNTILVVLLTMLGTTALLIIGAAGFWLLSRDNNANSNGNLNANLLNENTNVNTNLGIDANFPFNGSIDFNTNSNVNSNANTRTPTPTPSPTATPTPTPSPTESPDVETTPTPRPTATRTPIPTPSPTIIRPGQSPTPRFAPTPRRTPSPQMMPGTRERIRDN